MTSVLLCLVLSVLNLDVRSAELARTRLSGPPDDSHSLPINLSSGARAKLVDEDSPRLGWVASKTTGPELTLWRMDSCAVAMGSTATIGDGALSATGEDAGALAAVRSPPRRCHMAGRGASKTVGLGLPCYLLPSRANLTSSATPIGDHIAATAATTTDASAAARSRDRLSHDVSLCRSMAEAELSKPTGPKWNAPQHYWKRHAEPFASNTAQSQVVDERSAHGHSSTAVVMTNMNDEPCANAVDWGSNTVKARSTQVRPQSLHGSMWHSEVIQSLAQRSLRYPDSTMSFDLRSSLPGSNMDPRAEPLPFGQAWVDRPPLCPPAFAVGIANVLSHSRPTHSRPLSTSAMML